MRKDLYKCGCLLICLPRYMISVIPPSVEQSTEPLWRTRPPWWLHIYATRRSYVRPRSHTRPESLNTGNHLLI
jgi:hypothetical protein